MQATRPGSNQTVLEIDGDLVKIVEGELEFDRGTDTEIVVGDGRLSLADRSDASANVIVGDAFGSRAVPFHLTTREFMEEIERVLRPDGLYAANVIDSPSQRFLKVEAATIAEVWPYVVVVRGPRALAGFSSNSVILASKQLIDPASLSVGTDILGNRGAVVEDFDRFIEGAEVLTDDFAPVDQLFAG